MVCLSFNLGGVGGGLVQTERGKRTGKGPPLVVDDPPGRQLTPPPATQHALGSVLASQKKLPPKKTTPAPLNLPGNLSSA